MRWPTAEERIPLLEALKLYWFFLIPSALFPVCIFGLDWFGWPQVVAEIALLVMFVSAVLPIGFARASYSFWVAAVLTFLLSAIVTTGVRSLLWPG